MRVNLNLESLLNIKSAEAEIINKDSSDIVGQIQHDSREIQKGDWFICLKGESADGHKYIEQALKKGADGIIYEKTSVVEKYDGLAVKDCNSFLGEMAKLKREKINPFVFAVTGSNGKSSTKEIAAFFLSQMFSKEKVHKTSGNFNNQFGLPFTLLELEEKHEFAVIEMGTNHPGEIKQLSLWAKPDAAVITSIAAGHISFFQSTENIAEEKSDIICGMPAEGVLFVPEEIAHFDKINEKCKPDNIELKSVPELPQGLNNVRITSEGTRFSYNNHEYVYPAVGRRQFRNFTFIWQIFENLAQTKEVLKEKLPEILNHLHELKQMPGRLQLFENKKYHIWDDTYNANEASYKAAFEFIHDVKGNASAFGAFGSMAELGDKSLQAHKNLGKAAFQFGFTSVFFSSKDEKEIEAFTAGWKDAGGLSDDLFAAFNESSDIKAGVEFLAKKMRKDDHLLVKGSRSLIMERVFEFI
ncbi:MAG: UDP-N-acetylmuramoyl-tripeptide--D-alanyl-D-alanine ligase [Spirochaetia bacterium]|nr:UDP-N-acetylmuramoyl-tripeptide--D-alanyl-D-alanine ligase [Spirochaetia bacterium]